MPVKFICVKMINLKRFNANNRMNPLVLERFPIKTYALVRNLG